VQISDDTTTAIGWAGEVGHTGITLHSPHEWVDFKLIESKPTGEGYGNIFTTAAQMAAFQGGELALTDAQLDGPMREVFASLDTIPDHRLTLGELRAAQRSRGKLGELSRLIIRYPSEWKADPASWDAWDKNVPPTARAAWQSEKARIAKLVWWDAVAGKVEGFPVDSFVFHVHPVALVGNFMRFAATRLSEKGIWFIYRQEVRAGKSNRLHWPGRASGVTLGPGYDMKERSAASIRADMMAIGLSESIATSLSKGSGLTETQAQKFAQDNSDLLSLNQQQEFALLHHIVPHYEEKVRNSIEIDLAQHEFDALTCFAYNAAGRWDSVTRLVNEGDVPAVTAKIREGVKSNGKTMLGLVLRREDEVNLFVHARYEFQGSKIDFK
ncbi:glycoside hydrolase family protein, partial [Cupriavidus sp. M-11]|uniref:glycoside hydrolase family protein n=1 Tax=Cupriavidus sp. M-11 TaxID=3233038 RepID=UPI003F91EE04